jgi:long-chain acyl-CoA synthetase
MMGWNVCDLLSTLAARGRHPAVIAFGNPGTLTWDSETLVHHALRLARSLRQFDRDSRIGLWAPNSPHWIASALGVMAAGHVLVPLDDLADAVQFEAALASAELRLLLTTAEHAETSADLLRRLGIRVMLVGVPEVAGTDSAILSSPEELPVPVSDTPAVLSWTSGTTGSPKAFLLTHGNIAVNVAALRDLDLVGTADHVLLPLPFHHAYPFVVGLLTTLTLGTAIVLPSAGTGPALARALRDGQVTVIVGVPRLYEALIGALEARIDARGRIARGVWQVALRAAFVCQRSTGLGLGGLLLSPVRRGIGPHLRLLVSGGARLEPKTEETLEILGWTVLSGYGLAETASLFTGNPPGERRLGSVGRPLAGGEIRITDPDDHGIGEIELRGGSITPGYINNPEANRAAFTPDGWFRTGDLGFLDRDGFLFVTGRSKEILVLGGGKKVNPEDLERVYGEAPEITELALLEDKGGLVALVRPDLAKLRARGATNLRDGVRIVLGEKALGLPSYERLSGFALTDQPLPRTRLGKYRRFSLPGLYSQAVGGAVRRAAHVLGAEDMALLHDPSAAAVWQLLQQRYPTQAIDFDISFSLDLNIDSFGWMELTLLLQDRVGVHLSETDIAEIETIRDLLRRVVQYRPAISGNEPLLPIDIDGWLAPRGVFLRMLGAGIYGLNRLVMRSLFHLRTTGGEQLPISGPFVITPNHVSYLDAPAIAAALPFRCWNQVYWAGDMRLLFSNPVSRTISRALRIFPVDARRPVAAIAAAKRVLRAGGALVWFPEGWRSPDGTLQRFMPGIGELLAESDASAVPAYICGAFDAWPRTRRLPRLTPISVIFGGSVTAAALHAGESGQHDEEEIANALRERVTVLSESSRSPEGRR